MMAIYIAEISDQLHNNVVKQSNSEGSVNELIIPKTRTSTFNLIFGSSSNKTLSPATSTITSQSGPLSRPADVAGTIVPTKPKRVMPTSMKIALFFIKSLILLLSAKTNNI